MPIDARPSRPYGPMKKPSGMPNCGVGGGRPAHRCGSFGVGSGTGTMTPPGCTQSRHWPLEMNSGTGARSVVGSGVGAIGSSAATTTAGTR